MASPPRKPAGARVASLRCPILRSLATEVYCIFLVCTRVVNSIVLDTGSTLQSGIEQWRNNCHSLLGDLFRLLVILHFHEVNQLLSVCWRQYSRSLRKPYDRTMLYPHSAVYDQTDKLYQPPAERFADRFRQMISLFKK